MKKVMIVVFLLIISLVYNVDVMAKESVNTKTTKIENNIFNLNTNISLLAKNKTQEEGESDDSVISSLTQLLNYFVDFLRVVTEPLLGCSLTTTGGETTMFPISTTNNRQSKKCPYGFGTYNHAGETYCVVNNYNAPINEGMEKQEDYKNDGDNCCNCYVAAYYKRVLYQNVSKQYWGLKDCNKCEKSGVSVHNKDLDGTFNSIVNNNKPGIFHVESKIKHYLLVIGIKQSSYNSNESRSLSDFLVMDPYDQSIYNAAGRIPYYGGSYYWKILDVQYN